MNSRSLSGESLIRVAHPSHSSESLIRVTHPARGPRRCVAPPSLPSQTAAVKLDEFPSHRTPNPAPHRSAAAAERLAVRVPPVALRQRHARGACALRWAGRLGLRPSAGSSPRRPQPAAGPSRRQARAVGVEMRIQMTRTQRGDADARATRRTYDARTHARAHTTQRNNRPLRPPDGQLAPAQAKLPPPHRRRRRS